MNRTEIKDALRQFQANGYDIPKLSLKTEVLAAALAELNTVEVQLPGIDPADLPDMFDVILGHLKEGERAVEVAIDVTVEVSASPFRLEEGLKALATEFSFVNKYIAPFASFALSVALQFIWVAFLVISRADIPSKVQRATKKLLEVIKELVIEAQSVGQVIRGWKQLLS